MDDPDYQQRRQYESLDRSKLESLQLESLNRLLERILPHSQFYSEKLAGLKWPLASLEEFQQLPYTFKHELQQPDDFAANRTWPLDRYTRFHRTSGTQGRPMIVVDTAEDWQDWIGIWQYVLDAAHVTQHDRTLMAFSFRALHRILECQ